MSDEESSTASPWVWVGGKPAPERIEIVEYDPRWVARYEEFAAGIQAALGDTVVLLQHVGSTSVPGLAAKDVIDIDLAVADPRIESLYVPQLSELGYRLTVREPEWYEHRCFRFDQPRVNLHVFGPECPELSRHRIFRDWLCGNAEDRVLYEEAKRAAAVGADDVMVYNQRKEDVILGIYERAIRGV